MVKVFKKLTISKSFLTSDPFGVLKNQVITHVFLLLWDRIQPGLKSLLLLSQLYIIANECFDSPAFANLDFVIRNHFLNSLYSFWLLIFLGWSPSFSTSTSRSWLLLTFSHLLHRSFQSANHSSFNFFNRLIFQERILRQFINNTL